MRTHNCERPYPREIIRAADVAYLPDTAFCRHCGYVEPIPLSADKVEIQCMECDHRFTRKVSPRLYEIKCPKCGGYDTEIG